MQRHLSSQVRELFDAQLGLAHRRQLREAGLSAAELRWWVGHGWCHILPGVLAWSAGMPTATQRLVAALLYGGPGAMLTGPTAARWFGSENAVDDDRVHLVVPAHRSVTPNPAVAVSRTRRPDPDVVRQGALALASPARAFADTARGAGRRRDAQAVVIEGVQRELVTLAGLRAELEQGPRCGSSFLRAGIDAASTGAWSLPEYDLFTAMLASRRYPAVLANPVLSTVGGLRLPTPDCWLDDVGLAIQVHSRRHHFGVRDWERTLHQDGVFSEHGIPVLAVTPRSIRHDIEGVLARVARAHSVRLGLPRPAVVATPRDVR